MTAIVARRRINWAARRRAAADLRLARALQIAGFPVSLDDALSNAELRDPLLKAWAREAIRTNRVRYTAQLEMLARRGQSLADVAHFCSGREHGSALSIRQTLVFLSAGPDDPADYLPRDPNA